jgi:hypothetical protein
MNKKDIRKLIDVVINQSSKKDNSIFLTQIEEFIAIPVVNILQLNNKELKELKKTLLSKINE